MVVPDVDRAASATWTYMSLPAGSGLSPVPPTVWNSREVQRAAADGTPGAVIAIARQAYGLHQGRLGAMSGFSQSSISRLESGGNLAFDVRALRIFQRLLGIPPHLLGLSDDSFPLLHDDAKRLLGPLADDEIAVDGRTTDGRTVPVAVDRHTLLAACTSSVFGALPLDSLDIVEANGPVDPDAVRRLRVVRRLLNESDNWLGPGNLAPAVREMYQLTDRMRRSAKGELRRQLLDVAGTYAEFCGWLHQEVGDLRGALDWTERALQQAQAADNRDLVAYVYVRMGQLAEAQGDADRIVGLARAAEREPDLSPAVRALALQQKASGHALSGDASACLNRLDDASAAVAEIRRRWSDEYQVGGYFCAHHLNVRKAACLLELGQPQDAVAVYLDNQPSRTMLCRWEQGLHTAKLARAYAAGGEGEHAATLGFEALAMSRNTGSAMVVNELRMLRTWRHIPAIAALTDAIGSADTTATGHDADSA